MARPRVLSDEAVEEIMAKCKLRNQIARDYSAKALAQAYGVCRGIIHRISVYGHDYRVVKQVEVGLRDNGEKHEREVT